MCTCCQNWTNRVGVNSSVTSGCGYTQSGCGYTQSRCGGCMQNRCGGCVQSRCGGCMQNRCGQSGYLWGCNSGCYNGCGNRYISFPISGTAVVPTSSIYFYPTSWGTSGGCFGTQTTNTSGGCYTNGCFGRCGGAAAIANYYEDYYARQYGLND